jgi:addiction module HigA family antidote
MVMFNPPHPGRLVREFMGEDMTVTQMAQHLKMTRANLSMILYGRTGISAMVAIKLSEALPNWPPSFWLLLQNDYDLWHASRIKRVKLRPIHASDRVSRQKAA